MKRILSVTLIIFILIGGILGCKKPEGTDEHAGLYGTYKMLTFENGGIDIYFAKTTRTYTSKSKPIQISDFSKDANDQLNAYINEVIEKAGDTIAVYKDKKVRFSGGTMEREFEYHFFFSWSIDFERTEFPFNSINIEKWISVTPPIWELSTWTYLDIGKETYSIYFFYSEINKF